MARISDSKRLDGAFLAGLIAESRREGLLDDDEGELLTGAVEFEQRTAADVMLPREQLAALPVEATAPQVQEATAKTGYSRFPLVDRDGEISSYLHVKDRGRDQQAGRLGRRMPTVAAADSLSTTLDRMRAESTHLAQVADEHGTTLGVVALEDVLEELIGDVRDGARVGRAR